MLEKLFEGTATPHDRDEKLSAVLNLWSLHIFHLVSPTELSAVEDHFSLFGIAATPNTWIGKHSFIFVLFGS